MIPSCPAGPKPLVELRNVTLWSGGRRLFPDTCWTIRPGEHWAIVGPNASGKGTLARALCSEVPVVQGEIRYPAAEAEASRESQGLLGTRGGASEVAHVTFQDQARLVSRYSRYLQGRYESLEGDDAPTVGELIRASPAGSGAEAMDLMRRLGLEELTGRRVQHLSNGEARKLLIARALLRRPRLLVLEEPLQGLDAPSRLEVGRLLLEVAATGTGIVLVTAVPGDVMAPVDHVVCVRGGTVVGWGEPRDLVEGGRLAQTAGPMREREARIPRGRFGPRPDRNLIELRNVTVSYDDVRVLDDVCWTVREGESWALIGPNGAGKTTLLSLILADHPQAYANDVRLFGHRRGEGLSIWDIKRHLGHVSPEAQIHDDPRATVLQAVCSAFADGTRLRHDASARELRAARRWADAMGLGRMLDTPCGMLSYGMRRLALLARALVKNPRLLVLDEPCQGLDEPHRRMVLAVVEQVCGRRDSTVIFVTHDAREMPASIDHVLSLDRGRARIITTEQARAATQDGRRQYAAACPSRRGSAPP